MLLWGTEQADTRIDITDVLDIKIKAVMAHRSQMKGRSDQEIEDFVKERAKEAGAGEVYIYAEAFRKVTFRV